MKLTRFEYNILYRLIKDDIQKGMKNGKVYSVKRFTALYELQKKIKLDKNNEQ